MTFEEFCSHLQGIEGKGKQRTALCPAHGDKHQSLSVSEGEDGRILVKCHYGCSTKDIVSAMGLTLQDLFPTPEKKPEKKPERKIVASYNYTDIDGNFLNQKTRWQTPDGKTFTWSHKEGGQWRKGHKGLPVLYNLPATKRDFLYIVEGEKDVETLKAQNFPAVSGAHGAGKGKWLPQYTEALKGKEVAIIQDNDENGKAFALETAQALTGKAKSVKLLDLSRVWPEIPEKGDVSDMLEAMGQIEGLRALLKLTNDTPEFMPDVFGRAEYTQQPPEKRLESISAAELQKMPLPPVQFIINGLLPVGLGLLVSPPKYGKSWMVLDMGLSVTTGAHFLGRSTNPGGCLYLALEDSLNRLKDRMEKVLKGAAAPVGFEYAVKCLDLSHGLLEQLDNYLQEKPDTRLIIIDTLQKIRGAGGRENAYNADYREMGLLKAFADQHKICILLVHHLRKMADDGDPFNRISGTAAIFGAADVAMVLSREKREDTQTKLSYQGRDIEGGDQILEFDKEAFRWKLLGDESWLAEERARAAYQNNPIVQTIKKLLKQHPEGWSGTSSELLDAGKVLISVYLANSPRDLTSKLAPLDKPLFDYDKIVHTRGSRGTGGGKHRFYYALTDKYEQTVFPPIIGIYRLYRL